jgi:hypothetical protein
MLLKKSSFFKMILAALLLINVVGCKKSNINTPSNDITNQPNYQFKLPLTSFITHHTCLLIISPNLQI